jgi:putative ABC transport system substrate-binding protein
MLQGHSRRVGHQHTDAPHALALLRACLLKETAPRITRVAAMFNPAQAPYAEIYLNPFKAAAQSFDVEARVAPVKDTSEIESVVAELARTPNGGLVVMPDGFTLSHRGEIVSLTARYRLPTVYAFRFFTEVGGLLSYGPDLTDNFRRAATYADRILKGGEAERAARRISSQVLPDY